MLMMEENRHAGDNSERDKDNRTISISLFTQISINDDMVIVIFPQHSTSSPRHKHIIGVRSNAIIIDSSIISALGVD